MQPGKGIGMQPPQEGFNEYQKQQWRQCVTLDGSPFHSYWGCLCKVQLNSCHRVYVQDRDTSWPVHTRAGTQLNKLFKRLCTRITPASSVPLCSQLRHKQQHIGGKVAATPYLPPQLATSRDNQLHHDLQAAVWI
ncbi:hypothetical protein ABBQ32_008776 [Trebouxia sp. C0010 RCD-2024]